jgi:HTH-type transcriptional regulator / antitoxin HigA
MSDVKLKKALLSCPGDTIQEHIDHIGLSQAELAERLGRSIPKLNELIKGKAPITKETATGLEYVLGIPASFWLNLERKYQDELLEIEQLEHLENCKDWLKGFPLGALQKMNILPVIRDKNALTAALLKFFRVASPDEWSTIYEGSSLTFKIELKHTTDPKAISAWLRIGEIQAEKLNLAPFDKKKLSESIPLIQEIIYQKPDSWKEKLQGICGSFGVALVYTPCISKAPIYGASRWIRNKTIPLIQLTDRQKDYNAFCFSFFHELAHIRYHNKSDIFIDGLKEIAPDQAKEAEADDFAARMLLSEKERNLLSQIHHFDKKLIIDFGRKFRKHPGILVAQIQRMHFGLYKNPMLNSLKERVEFEEVIL